MEILIKKREIYKSNINTRSLNNNSYPNLGNIITHNLNTYVPKCVLQNLHYKKYIPCPHPLPPFKVIIKSPPELFSTPRYLSLVDLTSAKTLTENWLLLYGCFLCLHRWNSGITPITTLYEIAVSWYMKSSSMLAEKFWFTYRKIEINIIKEKICQQHCRTGWKITY